MYNNNCDGLTLEELKLIEKLEGYEEYAYTDTEGKVTVGYGFNMDASSARDIWNKLEIPEDYDKVYDKEIDISKNTGLVLLCYIWGKAIKKAKARAEDLGYKWNEYNEFQKFILTDIAYNTGSVNNWTKVFAADGKTMLKEARRRQRELDSRIAKIGYHYGVISSLEEAIEAGLEEARFIL